MSTNQIIILPKNRIIIRTSPVWYMVSIQYVKQQMQFSKNPVFEKAYKMAKKEYGNKYEEN